MKKTFLKSWPFFLFVAFLFACLIIPGKDATVVSLNDPGIAGYFKLTVPAEFYAVEPFVGLPDYLLSFQHIKSVAASILLLFLIFFMFFIRSKKLHTRIIAVAFYSLLSFVIVVAYTVLFPVPKHKLIKNNNDYLLVDFHSHSTYSHDGIATVRQGVKWHARHNFDAFYLTDHSVNRYAEIPRDMKRLKSKILPGEEVQDREGNHLLIIGLDRSISDFLTEDPASLETKRLTETAHKNGGAVIVAHWWHEKGSGLNDLYASGVDGFEIYGREKTPLTAKTQKALLDFCREKNIIATGGSNWHGWGARNDVWTAIKLPGWQELDVSQLNKKIVDAIRNKRAGLFEVLVISRHPVYPLGLNFYQIASWIVLLFIARGILSWRGV